MPLVNATKAMHLTFSVGDSVVAVDYYSDECLAFVIYTSCIIWMYLALIQIQSCTFQHASSCKLYDLLYNHYFPVSYKDRISDNPSCKLYDLLYNHYFPVLLCKSCQSTLLPKKLY